MRGPQSFPINSFKLFKIFYIVLDPQEVNDYLKTFSLCYPMEIFFFVNGLIFNFY